MPSPTMVDPMPTDRPSSRPYLLAGLIWLAAATALGASHRISQLRPPAPQLVVLGLTLALLVAGSALMGFRAWLDSLRLRALVALHVTRLVAGYYFLHLYRAGGLPRDFAVPGGVGDIAVGSLALIMVLFVRNLEEKRRLVLVWNLLGLADIIFVVATAARLGMSDPASMSALLRLPLSLLPTFLVPLIIASHILIFARLTRPKS
ncbi:MAG: hypothetical protein ACREL3_07840 [Gemmatimonadales bacterium]